MSKANPKKIDYNKDNVVDQFDDELARQDLNKDGRVTPREKSEYNRQQQTTTQEVVTDPRTGRQTVKTTGAPPAPEPTMTAEGYGFSEQFLTANPDVREAIRLAIENGWSQEVLNRYIENQTDFGRRTTDQQAQFDIAIASDKAEDLQRQISDRATAIKRQAMAAGIDISDEEINQFARESIRSGLTDNDTLAFLSERFRIPQAEEGKPAAPLRGQAGDIVDELRNLARSYGVTLTEMDVQKKTREALNMGADWRSYVDGQRDIFRQQAKTLYPKIANLLDTSDLATIMNPYMADASELLGVSMAQMQTTDPLWQTALNGENGPLSRDEWLRALRTDQRFGYDRTVRARQEYTELADELLSAFGMA